MLARWDIEDGPKADLEQRECIGQNNSLVAVITSACSLQSEPGGGGGGGAGGQASNIHTHFQIWFLESIPVSCKIHTHFQTFSDQND